MKTKLDSAIKEMADDKARLKAQNEKYRQEAKEKEAKAKLAAAVAEAARYAEEAKILREA